MSRFLAVVALVLMVIATSFSQTPPTPTELRVTGSNSGGGTAVGAYLTWHAPNGNWQYRIYRSAGDTLNFAALATSPTRSYFDATILRGTRYYYYVKSFVGNTESGRSNIASIMLEVLPPLPTPTNLTAVNAPQGYMPGVRLNWRGGRGPWSYLIYRSTNDTLRFHLRYTVGDTTFMDRDVRADSTYYYYVRARYFNDTTLSPASNRASVLVTVPPRVRGTISGTVIDDSTNAPINHVMMTFYRTSASNWGCTFVFTDSLGQYSALLDTGRYIMRATGGGSSGHNTPKYRPEYYNNCYEPACATVITVGENTTFTANMGLARLTPPSYVYISGVVTDTANTPLRNARVSIIRTMQEMNFLASLGFVPGTGDEEMFLDGVGHTRGVVWSGNTDSLGRYRARVIANNNYIAMASKQGYLPEYYNNKPTAELADIIAMGNRDTTGIDFSLAVRPVPNNSISGVVRDSLGTLVPSRITLFRTGANTHHVRYAHTDSLGAYSITGLQAGKYFVLATPFSGYGPAFYKANAYGVIRIQDADTVNVTGNVTGINIGVRPITSAGLTVIQGTVRSTTNSVIGGVRLVAQNLSGEIVGIGVTDARGAYTINAVEPGAVTIVADRDGYSAGQTVVTVSTNNYTMNNVNITLTPTGVTTVGDNSAMPSAFSLAQNYPNPFNPSTTIRFDLPMVSKVQLRIFNLLGQDVATLMNEEVPAGKLSIVWNGKDNAGRAVASGIYFYQMRAAASGAEFSAVRKMMLLK
jgi:fibronectin type 3 domain-containing protein